MTKDESAAGKDTPEVHDQIDFARFGEVTVLDESAYVLQAVNVRRPRQTSFPDEDPYSFEVYGHEWLYRVRKLHGGGWVVTYFDTRSHEPTSNQRVATRAELAVVLRQIAEDSAAYQQALGR